MEKAFTKIQKYFH